MVNNQQSGRIRQIHANIVPLLISETSVLASRRSTTKRPAGVAFTIGDGVRRCQKVPMAWHHMDSYGGFLEWGTQMDGLRGKLLVKWIRGYSLFQETSICPLSDPHWAPPEVLDQAKSKRKTSEICKNGAQKPSVAGLTCDYLDFPGGTFIQTNTMQAIRNT